MPIGETPREEDELILAEQDNSYSRRLEQSRAGATEVQKNVQEIQSAKLGTSLLRIMERSGDNTEIVNNLNEFLNALEHQSGFGQSDKPLAKGRQEDLASFLGEAAKALRWTVGGGNRPADKIDLSKWSQ